MSLKIPPGEYGLILRQAAWFYFGGLVLFVCGLFSDSAITIAGMTGVMLGALIAGFGPAIFKKGMWFLAFIAWVGSLIIYGGFFYLHAWRLSEHPADFVRMIALLVTVWMLGIQTRLLYTVLTVNWNRSRAKST